ncbi:MAG: hypothetical protein ACOY93_04730 [Bacillota bacterium]
MDQTIARRVLEALRAGPMMIRVGVPVSVRECGVDQAACAEAIPEMARIALADRCTASNPRVPTLTDLEHLFRDAYGPE